MWFSTCTITDKTLQSWRRFVTSLNIAGNTSGMDGPLKNVLVKIRCSWIGEAPLWSWIKRFCHDFDIHELVKTFFVPSPPWVADKCKSQKQSLFFHNLAKADYLHVSNMRFLKFIKIQNLLIHSFVHVLFGQLGIRWSNTHKMIEDSTILAVFGEPTLHLKCSR